MYEQFRGSLRGFPLSGALCVATVMHREMQALAMPSFRPNNKWVAARYVDNLLTIHMREGQTSHLPQELWEYSFYGSTILLEFECDLAYLGMDIVPTRRAFELAMSVPGYAELEDYTGAQTPRLFTEKWRYRSVT